MAVKNPPIAISTRKDHDAPDFRQALSAAFAAGPDMSGPRGVVPGWGDEFDVTVGSGLQVVVGSGLAQIPAPGPGNGSWPITNDADVTINLAAAHPSNARIDLIIARVSDGEYHPGADGMAAIEPITGVASASPAVPSVPTSKGEYLELRRVTVGAGASSLEANDLALPPGGVPFTSLARPSRTEFAPVVRAISTDGSPWNLSPNAGEYSVDGVWLQGVSASVNADNGPSPGLVHAQFITPPRAPKTGYVGSLGSFAYVTDVGAPAITGEIMFGFYGAYGRLAPGGSLGFGTSNQYHLACNWHYPVV